MTKENRSSLFKTAKSLAIFTIVYNLIEGIVATWFGFEDEALSLFGFGVDSFIEMISGVGIFYMVIRIEANPESHHSQFEKNALRITGWCFYLLAGGLVISSVMTLIIGHTPVNTWWGVVISLISILVMILLLRAKVRVGKLLQSEAILADANCTRVCIYMSCVLLLASGIYEATGFPYADAIGTLGLAWFSVREGRECFETASTGKCCDHHH